MTLFSHSSDIYKMNTFLHQKFIENLQNKLRLPCSTSVLLGLSGGQDSLCMVKLFLDIQKLYHLEIGVINIDHQWRHDSVNNTFHVINMIQSLKVKTYIYEIRPFSYTEEEARNIRYQLFLETARQNKYSFIATAHNLNDQIETGLHNIFRGSDIDSLQSLTWSRHLKTKIQLVRPMLNIQRWEIEWFCRYFALPIWHDFSNLECIKERNRIRQELIPYIQYHFSYNIECQISKFMEYAYIDCEYMRQNTLKLYLKIKHPYFIAVNTSKLRCQHQALQRRVLQLFLLHNTRTNIPVTLLNQLLNSLNKRLFIKIPHNQIMICNNMKWIYLYYNKSISYNNFSQG